MTSDDHMTLRSAGKQTGIPERTLRRWAEGGKLPFVDGGARGRLVRVADVTAAATQHGRMSVSGRGHAADLGLEAGADADQMATAMPARIDPAPLLARFDQLYRNQLDTKDELLAAKDELIEELRRRAEDAERRLSELDSETESPAGRWGRFRALFTRQ